MVTVPHFIDEESEAIKGSRQHRISREQSRKKTVSIINQSQASFRPPGVTMDDVSIGLPLLPALLSDLTHGN